MATFMAKAIGLPDGTETGPSGVTLAILTDTPPSTRSRRAQA